MSSLMIFLIFNFFQQKIINMNFMSPLECFHFMNSSNTVLSEELVLGRLPLREEDPVLVSIVRTLREYA